MLAIAAFAVLGWLLLRRIRSGYLRKTINERSLTLDVLWLVFASFYSIGFALLGLGRAAAGLLAFAAYKLASIAGIAWFARPPRVADAVGDRHGLVFLRVFSLGRRSDELFDAVARYWRYIGTMELITGPDVAHSTVQPHQLLDFLSGRLADHFVADAESLELRMKHRDAAADRDGLFRINNFFCYADTWEAALARLVQEGDVVLMDLRNLSSDNAGCVRELRHLVTFVPLGRCVFVVDETTDHAYLRNPCATNGKVLRPDRRIDRSAPRR